MPSCFGILRFARPNSAAYRLGQYCNSETAVKTFVLLSRDSLSATLSRVVNGADNVSGERRTKVLTAVSELQYCPNLYAAELGRANRNIPKQLGIHVPVLARHKGKRQF